MKKSIFILLLFSVVYIYADDFPNIIWITVDTLRKDYVYKWSDKNLTPSIDSLMKDSIVLENCSTPTPITFPSFTSAFTGCHPLKHNVFFNTGFQVPKNLKTITEILKEKGYTTIAVIGGSPLHYGRGIERGFDIYDDNFLKRPKTGNPLFKVNRREEAIEEMAERPAEDITELGLNYLKNSKKPTFLFLHYYDPHTPYKPPQEFLKKYPNDLYSGEVAYTDFAIGKFLEELKKLKIYDESMIVFFSDHGEGLGEHKEDTHGYFLYNTTVTISASIKLPYSKIKKEIKEITTIIDIAPTVCDLIGEKMECQGISLKNSIYKNENLAKRDFILMTKMGNLYFGFEEIYGLLSYPYKAVFSSEPEVFDLSKDEREEKNLYPENFRDLKKKYIKILKEFENTKKNEISTKSEDTERLKSLGYLAPTPNLPKKNVPPSKWYEIIDLFEEGNLKYYKGEYEEAIKIYSNFLKKDKENFRILMEKGMIEVAAGKYEEALSDFNRAKKIIPNAFEVYDNLLNLFLITGNIIEFNKTLKEAEARFPDDLKIASYKIEYLKKEKKLEEAKKIVDKFLKIFPKEENFYIYTIDIFMEKNDLEGLKNFLGEALKNKSEEKPIFLFLKGMEKSIEKKEELSLDYFKKSIEKGAQFYHPYYFIGLEEKRKSRFEDALKYLKIANILSPYSVQVLYELADTEAILGKFEDSFNDFSKALNLNRENFSIRISLFKLSFILWKEKEKKENLEWLLKNHPKELENLKERDPILKEIFK